MKKNIIFMILMLLLFFLSGCWEKTLLEYDYIMDFNIQEFNNNDSKLLKISGLCGHSSYVIKDIYTTINDDSLIINIEIYFSKKKNETGSFECEIGIPHDVNKVVLGRLKKEIWSRNSKKLIKTNSKKILY